MPILLTILMSVFSMWAGIKVSRSFHSGNQRRGSLLLGMWSVMYIVYIFAIFSLTK